MVTCTGQTQIRKFGQTKDASINCESCHYLNQIVIFIFVYVEPHIRLNNSQNSSFIFVIYMYINKMKKNKAAACEE